MLISSCYGGTEVYENGLWSAASNVSYGSVQLNQLVHVLLAPCWYDSVRVMES